MKQEKLMACTEKCRKPVNRQCHCAMCHRTFTGPTWFDLHLVGGGCREVDGLVERDGLWATVEGHENRLRLKQRLDLMRGQ